MAAKLVCCHNIVLICIKRIISKDKLHIDALKAWFDSDQVFNNKEVFSFYKTIKPNVKETTVNWRIYSLVQLGIISRVGKGKYVFGKRNVYTPEISPELLNLNNKIIKNFPFVDHCLWSTSAFNEFMLHQPAKFFLLVEVDRYATESIFYFLKERNYSVFLEPDKVLLNRYIPDEKETWIVKSLVTEAPKKIISGVSTITMEKLLVDLFCDTVVLNAQQGPEKDRIFEEAYEKYTINENTMLRYADRRRRKSEFDEYLNKVSKHRQRN